MKAIFAIAAAAIVAVSPAAAEPRTPKPVSEPAAREGVPAPKAREQRVCLVDSVTGSRIARRDCRTRADWKTAGIQLPAGL